MSSRVQGWNTGSLPVNEMVVRNTPIVVPTYTVSGWPGSTATAMAEAVVAVRRPVRNHLVGAVEPPELIGVVRGEVAVEGEVQRAAGAARRVVDRDVVAGARGATSVFLAGWNTASSPTWVIGCHTPPTRRSWCSDLRRITHSRSTVAHRSTRILPEAAESAGIRSWTSLGAPARGSLFDGSVTQLAPQFSVYQTRLVATASWLAAPLRTVLGAE